MAKTLSSVPAWGDGLRTAIQDEIERYFRESHSSRIPPPKLELAIEKAAERAAQKAIGEWWRKQQSSLPPRASSHEQLLAPVDEAARIVGVGISSMWAFVKAGKVETVSLGHRRLIVLESLRRFIDERRTAPHEVLAHPPRGRGRPPRRTRGPIGAAAQ